MSMSLIVWLLFYQLANVAGPAPVSLSLAFGAGMFSTLSPCGFALLSAYVTYMAKQQMERRPGSQPTGWQSLLHAGTLGLPLLAGVLMVLLGAAGVLALGGSLLVHLFPWLSVVVGAGLVLLGGWTLFTGRTLSLPGLAAVEAKLSPSGQAVPRFSRVMRVTWGFGVGYGLASLGCALPVFFLLIGTAMMTTGMGIALVLLAVTLFATTMGDLLRSAVFPLLGWVQRVSSLFLIVAGLYIVISQVPG